MRNRLFFALGGGIVGLLLAGPIRDAFELRTLIAALICCGLGMALGYVSSLMMDVFTANIDS